MKFSTGSTSSENHPNAGEAAASLTAPTRLAALAQTGLMDSAPEERFDRITRVAAVALRAPVALVSLVSDDRQFFKSCFGLDGAVADERQTPISHSFCQHAVTSGEPLIIADARTHPLVHDNPSIRDLGVIAYAGIPLVVESGDVIGSMCVIDTKPRDWTPPEINMLRDLAASVMTEINLQAAKDRAEAANRAKDRFLAILSHELRMPLSPSLMVVASMAQDPDLSPSVREDAALVQRNIEHQAHLIDDLLDITRIENGKLALTVASVDLHELIRQSIEMGGFQNRSGKIKVTVDLRASSHTVSGDRNRLRQVFSNVLKNALKFTPSGGSVAIKSEDAANAMVRVTLNDSGVGIRSDILPTLFAPFAQGMRSGADEHGGLGLGLAICRGIIAAHGGTIAASSEGENRGTTVVIELPAVAVEAAAKVVPAPRVVAPASPPRPCSILLVDDHEDTLRAMSRLLRRLEHRVVTANCVQSALRAADQENFDLLISDVGLPDGTGLDLMRQLLNQRPIRGIALTGYGTDNDLRQTREAGFSSHLTKPIDFRALESAIRTVSESIN